MISIRKLESELWESEEYDAKIAKLTDIITIAKEANWLYEKYNIQRIDNDSNDSWNYLIITDRGRIAPMRKTARAIRAFNPIHSKYSYDYVNKPICNLIEDILEKDSKESYFIQIADFISYFVHLYFDTCIKGKDLPNRVSNVIDKDFIINLMNYLKSKDKFNLKASKNDYGLVIYPK